MTQTTRLGDKAARGEINALRKLSQEERLKLLIASMAETGGTREDDDGAGFRKRLAAQRRASRRPPQRKSETSAETSADALTDSSVHSSAETSPAPPTEPSPKSC